MKELSDTALVVQALDGETNAFAELVSRYENTARVVALRNAHHHHLAEDAVQQAFLIVYERLGSLRKPDRFGSWLIRIVQRESQRQRRQATSVSTENADMNQIARKDQALAEGSKRAIEMLNQLPDHERIVMSLHFLDGYSTPEIARMLDKPLGTVTKQLSRATKRMQSLAQRPGART